MNNELEKPVFTDNLEYIIKIFEDSIDSKYDYEKYKISKLSQLLRSISSINDLKKLNDFIYFHYLLFDKSLNAYIYSNEKNDLEVKFELRDLDYNFNKIFEVLDEFKIDNDRLLSLKVFEHLKKIKEIFNNLKLEKSKKLNNKIQKKEIKFEFKINENDIECIYSYYSQNEESIKTYKDEKIGDPDREGEGLVFLLYEIKYDLENNENNSLQNNSIITRSRSIDFNTKTISSYNIHVLNIQHESKILEFNKIELKNKVQNIKQLKNGDYLIGEEHALYIYMLNLNQVNYIDVLDIDNIIDFWEIYNKNKNRSQILIASKNKNIIVKINKDAYNNYMIFPKENESFNKEFLNGFELEINNYIFKLNIINFFQIYLEMNNNNIKNEEQMPHILKYLLNSPESIFKYTNLKENNKFEFKGYSKNNNNNEKYFVKSENGICFIPSSNNEEFTKLLLACNRKVDSNEEQYKLFIISFDFDGNIYSKHSITFLDTKKFEVLCICPILIIGNNNIIDYNPDDSKTTITNLFLVGGFDHETDQGKIVLFKLVEENGNYNIKQLTDIYFDNFEENKSSINCIIQSKVDGKFLFINEDGNLYSFCLLNIENYLK